MAGLAETGSHYCFPSLHAGNCQLTIEVPIHHLHPSLTNGFHHFYQIMPANKSWCHIGRIKEYFSASPQCRHIQQCIGNI